MVKIEQLYEARANIAKALAHPTRIAIIDLLSQNQEMCVCEIAKALNSKQSIISKHLSTLKNAGIIDSKKQGLQVFYHVRTPCVFNFFNCLDQIIIKDLEKRQKQLEKRGY